jgi:hypothetical protein
MKDEASLKRSASSRLNQSKRHAEAIVILVEELRNKFTSENMADLRDRAEKIIQCVHEYNAYANVINGDKA